MDGAVEPGVPVTGWALFKFIYINIILIKKLKKRKKKKKERKNKIRLH